MPRSVARRVDKKDGQSYNPNVIKLKFTFWKESDGKFLGFLNDFPDHWTQGEDMSDLKEHLEDLYDLFSSDDIPGIRQVQELEVESA